MSDRMKSVEPDASELEFAIVGPEVISARRAVKGTRPRSKNQQVIDELVTSAYDKWVKAGSPARMEERYGGMVRVTDLPEKVLWVQRAIRKAGAYLDLSIRFSQIVSEDGYTEVAFTATRKAEAE
jgi:hypothetical protein